MRLIRILLVMFAVLPDWAAAQAFPARPITIVVPFPPGSSSDLIPRALAPLMSQSMRVPVIVVAAESERMRKLVEVSGARAD